MMEEYNVVLNNEIYNLTQKVKKKDRKIKELEKRIGKTIQLLDDLQVNTYTKATLKCILKGKI